MTTKPDRRKRCAVALLAVLVASGCKGPTDPSHNTTETVSGAVQPLNQGPLHTFTFSNTGEFTVTLSSLTPGNTYIGIQYGQFSGGCVTQQSTPVSSGSVGKAVLSGQVLLKGPYCVQLFDPSVFAGYPSLTVAQNYTIQVNHP